MSETTESGIQAPPPEERHAEELAFLEAWDPGPRPPSWRLTPRAVVTFIVGSGGQELTTSAKKLVISEKFVGERALVERCVVTLAGERGLLLVGEPGTAKSMLSELLAAGVSGSSRRTVQGTAGTTEEHLRYGWNYAVLLARGPGRDALVPSPILVAMEAGGIARVEEVTRCLPEVQDALVSILSDRRLSVPELGDDGAVYARQGFNVIATANLRDRGVSEMSAALKRRFNFETVPPIADLAREVELVERQATSAVARVGLPLAVDRKVLEVLVTAFRDLRAGRSREGWAVDKPSTVMSTAEAVGVATSMALQGAYFDPPPPRSSASEDRFPLPAPAGSLEESRGAALRLLPGYLLGVVLKDDPKDRGRLLAWWDGAVKRRAEQDPDWKQLHELRHVLEG